MGVALALASVERGWSTTLLLGPTSLSPPEHSLLTTFRFRTTADLAALLRQHWPAHDVLFMAAAVADFTPAKSSIGEKLSRTGGPLTLTLDPTPDLLASIAPTTRPNQVRIGFALEAQNELEDSARAKLKSKQLDAIVANPLETMDSSEVTGSLMLADGRTIAAPQGMPKTEFARWLVQTIGPLVETRLASA